MNNYYIAGNRGLVGTNYSNRISNSVGGNTSNCDYTDLSSTDTHIAAQPITHLILNAATVGGLQDDIDNAFNIYLTNLSIQNNILKTASKYNIDRLLFQSSACAYPDYANHPFEEQELLSSPPNSIYLPTALPKITGMHQCIAHNNQKGTHWTTAVCSNMYGPYDRTGEKAHVIGALMKKFIDAVKNNIQSIEIWGDGTQLRDYIYIDDAVTAMELIINNNEYDVVNVATGTSTSISNIVNMLVSISNYSGSIIYNTYKPQGSKAKLINNKKLKNLGWQPTVDMYEGLVKTYRWYYDNI